MGGSKPFCSSSSQVVPKEYLRVKECRREEKPSERRSAKQHTHCMAVNSIYLSMKDQQEKKGPGTEEPNPIVVLNSGCPHSISTTRSYV
jgi:hypothetical protein